MPWPAAGTASGSEQAQLVRLGDREAGGDVHQGFVRRGLVGDHIRRHLAQDQLLIDIGGVADEPDESGLPAALFSSTSVMASSSVSTTVST